MRGYELLCKTPSVEHSTAYRRRPVTSAAEHFQRVKKKQPAQNGRTMEKPKNSSITSFFAPQQKLTTQQKQKKKTKNSEDTQLKLNAQRTRRTPSPPRVTIDLTLDSPVKPVVVPLHPQTTNQTTTTTTFNSKQIHSTPKKVTNLKSFSDFENTRRQKIKNNTRPLVSPAWPTDDFIHQRCLDNKQHDLQQDLLHSVSDNNHHDHAIKFSRRKGKRPIRNAHFLVLNSDQDEEKTWVKNILHTDATRINNEDVKLPSPSPTLNRLDLRPPIELLPQVNDDPIYQHPLLQRLLKLLHCPDASPITFDHPALRRQHHRAPDSLIHLWTTKYAPKKASEMLGDNNVQTALTLKSWLLEIALKEAHHPIDDQPPDQKKAKKRNKQKKSSKPKRVIIRSVEAPKRKSRRLLNSDSDSDGLKDFIVSDDETEDKDTIFARDISVSESEGCSTRSPRRKSQKNYLNLDLEPVPESSSLSSKLNNQEKIKFKNLTNLILLQGPNGVGKSCAVQAVAEELGWEVFEVNPGLLRNRKELDRLIGDVSKNHVLSCSSPKKPYKSKNKPSSQPSINSLSDPDVIKVDHLSSKSDCLPKTVNPFAKMMQKTKRKIELLEEEEEESTNFNAEKYETSSNGNTSNQPRTVQKPTKQSLILLEEVDIVYGQDKDFWAGVVELVSKSMRPIVMTCNDSSILPIESLPIQMILEFKPPSVQLTSRFLQLIALIEGHLIDLIHLEKLYSHHVYELPLEFKLLGNKKTHFNLFEILQFPSNGTGTDGTIGEGSRSDVRRSMNQLQFYCQWAIGSRFLGIDWLDLQQDKTDKMLFCSYSLPSFITTSPHHHQLFGSNSSEDKNPLDRYSHDRFEWQWFDEFFLHLDLPNDSNRQVINHQSDSITNGLERVTGSNDDQLLFLLAKAHDDLSFADAFVDKDLDIDVYQFESEIKYSLTDNVILDNSRLTNPSTIEIKKIKTTNHQNQNNKSLMIMNYDDDDDYNYDLGYLCLHPKRPFSLLHYSLEKTLFRCVLFFILNSFFVEFFPLPSPPPPSSSSVHVDHNTSHVLRLGSHFLVKYLNLFDHSKLIKIRTRNLKEMNEYMDFNGSQSYPMNMQEYITEYNAYIRLIFQFEHSKRINSHDQEAIAGGRFLRKSVRLNQSTITNSTTTTTTSWNSTVFVLDLSPLEIHTFSSLVKNLV